ncbi:uncharacterized protein K02A2.6-like [Octopus bimaculoides]|uniref:uncharacterized protein K02A2.6-like n=1 Tax=Octopus bimaculoides TaxID=37653 RepID=UPI00071DB9A0|nr:uncharacterized protein K02A2.6-like [Octopus bimaculoides]|eukprot:XP_014769106.1 PREDICTED: uncharacterized protein K02A2.6-like [Octopus bimaculoides]
MGPYHPRSNGQAECFVDIFKSALRKPNKEVTDEVAFQSFLRVYHVTPNPNTPAGLSPAKLMFVRKIKSVFNKLLPGKKRIIAMENTARYFKIGAKRFVQQGTNVECYESGGRGDGHMGE